MIKGISLGICISVFIVSLILVLSGATGNLQENIITGGVIGPGQVVSYSLVALFLSFIIGSFILIKILKH